jgi:hypothetical protein
MEGCVSLLTLAQTVDALGGPTPSASIYGCGGCCQPKFHKILCPGHEQPHTTTGGSWWLECIPKAMAPNNPAGRREDSYRLYWPASRPAGTASRMPQPLDAELTCPPTPSSWGIALGRPGPSLTRTNARNKTPMFSWASCRVLAALAHLGRIDGTRPGARLDARGVKSFPHSSNRQRCWQKSIGTMRAPSTRVAVVTVFLRLPSRCGQAVVAQQCTCAVAYSRVSQYGTYVEIPRRHARDTQAAGAACIPKLRRGGDVAASCYGAASR